MPVNSKGKRIFQCVSVLSMKSTSVSKTFHIVLMTIVNADYTFLLVDIGYYGKYCDCSILQNTNFWTRRNRGKKRVSYVFIGIFH